MTTSVLTVAKRMGEISDWSLSNLAMQKLAYIAHMLYLGQTETPLVWGHFEAWDLGPVIVNYIKRPKSMVPNQYKKMFSERSVKWKMKIT